MNTIKRCAVCGLLGAAAFWAPDTLVHVCAGKGFSGRQAVLLAVLQPEAVLGATMAFASTQRLHCTRLMPLFVLAGIWLAAGPVIALNSTFSGGGPTETRNWNALLIGLLPPVALMMAGYDGSLFALLGATACLLVLAGAGVRPRITAALAASVLVLAAAGWLALAGPRKISVASSAGDQGTTVQRDEGLDDLALALKSAYLDNNPPAPPYLRGAPPVLSLTNLNRILTGTGLQLRLELSDFLYCNLSAQEWSALTTKAPDQTRPFGSALEFGRTAYEEMSRFGEYPLVWAAVPGSSNDFRLITVAPRSEIFRPCVVSLQDLNKQLFRMQSLVREETGDEGVTLDARDKPPQAVP